MKFIGLKGSDGGLKIKLIFLNGQRSTMPNDDISNPVPKEFDDSKDITIEDFLREYKRLKWHQTSVKSTYTNP